MTLGQKICPKSGERCDCPKGICNAAVEALVIGLATNPQGDYWNGVPEFDYASATLEEQGQADSLEAHSLKYQACAQIMQLSSGKFALFGAYRQGGGSGIELVAIGEWAELEPHVRAYKELADAAWAQGQERTLPAKTAADYNSLFGEEKPDAE